MSDAPETAEETNSKQAETPRRRRWPRRLLIVALLLFAAYTLIGFFGVPYLVRTTGATMASEQINGTVTIGRVSFNPFTLRLALEQFEVVDGDGELVARIDRGEGDLQLISTIFSPGIRLRNVRATDPYVRLERREDGAINLLTLRVKSADDAGGGESAREIPRLIIENFAVVNGSADVRDRAVTPTFETAVEDLHFTIDQFDTAPDHDNEHEITAELASGGDVTWRGDLRLDPLTATGRITLDTLALAAFSPYVRQAAGLDLSEGAARVEIDYELAPFNDEPRLNVALVETDIDDLHLVLRDRTMLQLDGLEVRGLDADLHGQGLTLERAQVRGLAAHIRRDADGGFEFVAVAPAGDPDAAPDPHADSGGVEYPLARLVDALEYLAQDLIAGWSIAATEVDVSESTIFFDDQSTSEPVEVTLTNVALQAGPFQTENTRTTSATFSASTPDGATVSVSLELDPAERWASADLKLETLDIPTFRAYLPREISDTLNGATLTSGVLELDGTAAFKASETTYEATWGGRVALTELATSRDAGPPPLAVTSLALDGDAVVRTPKEGPGVTATWDGRVAVRGFKGAMTFDDADFNASLNELTTDGALEARADGDETPRFTWSGGMNAAGVSAEAGAPWDSTATLGSARLESGRLEWSDTTRAFDAALIALESPVIKATIPASATPAAGEDGSPAASGDGGGVSDPPLAIRLGTLKVTQGAFDVTDRTIDPVLAVSGTGFELTVENFDTAGGAPATVDVRTQVAEVGVVGVSGAVDAFRSTPFVDVNVSVEDLPMRPFSPRAAPQLGYAIDSGRLSLSMPVKVEQGRLDGRIDAKLRSFRLGSKVQSPSAIKAPVKLGLDLLRDGDDVIAINVGLSGDVNDPNFSIGDVIWSAVGNVVGNVAKAPFRLIGNLVGAGDDVDLSQVAFQPGLAQLAPGSADRIDTLARALNQRPSLRLVVQGVTDEADAVALREARLQTLIDERRSQGAATIEAALQDLFATRFPDEARVRVPIPPGRPDQAAADPAVMRERLLASIELADDALPQLARQRAERVVQVLTEQSGLATERVQAVERLAGAAPVEAGPKAVFELLSGG